MTTTDIRAADRYPTRQGPGTEIMDRVDPVVWPADRQGPATAEELSRHAANGFHVVDGLLSRRETQSYSDELRRLARDGDVLADQRTVVERGTESVRSIFEVHRISGLIDELVHDPRLLDRARQILGSEVYIHQSRINYMPGFTGGGFYWHSDFETWHAEDGMPAPRAVSASIALTDNYPFNGALMLMPGAHRSFVCCGGRTPAEHYTESLQQQQVGVPDRESLARLCERHGIDQFTGSAGSVLWFDANSMHGSGNNITPYHRSNIFVVFNSVENALAEPFAAPDRRPRFIANPDPAPLSPR